MTASPALIAYLADLPGRCADCGFDARTQGHRGNCPQRSEWHTFLAALKKAARSDGTIHQGDVRPLIQGIPHKHRGQFYRRAKAEGIIRAIAHEPSTDFAGGNSDKTSTIYQLRSNA